MSEQFRGGIFDDTKTDIIDEEEASLHQRCGNSENLNYRNNAHFQKEIESKIFTLKLKEPLETDSRTIFPEVITDTETERITEIETGETEIETVETRTRGQSPEKTMESDENNLVLVENEGKLNEFLKEDIEEENKEVEIENEAELEDGKKGNDGTVEANELNGDTITEPEPNVVPMLVGSVEIKSTANSDTDTTTTEIICEIIKPPPPPEEPVELPENPTTEHLFKAIEDGDVRMAKALIKAGVDLKKFNTEGYNTLHYAASKLNVEIMKAILESGPGKIDIEARTRDTDLEMLTALHVVSKNATIIDVSDQLAVDVARLLISHNADINSKAKDNFTPLGFAVDKSSNSELVKYLLEQGSDYKAVFNDINDNLLHLAMKSCNPDIIGLLISSGVPADALNSEFRQPIHDAALLGCIVGIEKLVLQSNIDQNVTTPLPNEIGDIDLNDERFYHIFCGSTPLHFAVLANQTKTVKYLLLCGAKPMIYDSKNCSAYDYAEDTNSQEIMDLIMKFHLHD